MKYLLSCLLVLCVPALVFAATATVVPTGDSSIDTWITSPLWSKVDEDIDSPGGDIITSPTNPATPTNDIVFTVTCPSDVGTITAANLRIRAGVNSVAGKTASVVASWSANAGNNVSTGTLTTTPTNYNTNQTGLSISGGTCNSSTFKVAPTTAGSGSSVKVNVDAINLDITYTASSGKGKRKQVVKLLPDLRRNVIHEASLVGTSWPH